MGLLQRSRRLFFVPVGPVEVRQPQTRRYGLRVGLDCLLERGLRLIASIRCLLQSPEAGVAERVVGVELDRLLDLLDCSVHIFEPGQRIAEQELSVDVLAVERERLVGTCLGILELLGVQQEAAGLQLRLDILGHEIRGADVLTPRARPIPVEHERFGKVVACPSEPRVLLQRIPILDDGFLGLSLAQELVAACEVLFLGNLWIARAGEALREDQRKGHKSIAIQSGVHLVQLPGSITHQARKRAKKPDPAAFATGSGRGEC